MLDAVAAVGGSTANVQDTNVQLTRGNVVRTIALEDLVAHPRQNILLRRGDVVTMITNPGHIYFYGCGWSYAADWFLCEGLGFG